MAPADGEDGQQQQQQLLQPRIEDADVSCTISKNLLRAGTAIGRDRHGKAKEGDGITKVLLTHRRPREKDEAARIVFMDGLKHNRFCKALDDEEKQALWDSMEHFAFKEGETIIKQGDRGHYFFVCQEGELEVNVGGVAASSLGPGSAFGGIALLYNCPRTATVSAKSFVSVWGGDGQVFRKVLKDHATRHHAENRKFLDCLQIFDGLDSAQKDRIGQLALYDELHEAGSRVFVEGEEPAAIYTLKAGEITEWKGANISPEGKVTGGTHVAHYSNGDVFGIKAVLLGEKRTTTVVADTACELVVVGLPQLRQVLGDDFVRVLEQSFVLNVLKRIPVISSVGLSVTQRQIIAQAMQVSDFSEGAVISNGDIRLGVVIDGEVAGKRRGEPITLRRGDWWEDEALSGAVEEANKAASTPRMIELVVGSSTARLATLRKDDLAQALQEMGLSSISRNSEEVIDHMRKILLAKKVPIFRDLSEEQVDGLVSSLVLKRFSKGAKVFKQGEVGTNFYIIAMGEVKVLIDGGLVRTLGKGTCFGERALLFDERRSATVEVSSEEADLWSVERVDFNKVVTETMRAELMHRIELQSATVDLKSLKHVRLIGAGAFGSVRLVEHKHKKKRYALKRVRKQPDPADGGRLAVPPEVMQEVELLASMDHPFVLRMVRSFETENSLYILTELITGGQLYEQTHERMGVLSRKQAQFYIGSLVCILEAVHGAGIVYRDLKPENVMLDERGFLKLVDFGLAKRLDPLSGKTFTAVGTMLYMAPELIRGRGYGFEVDVWSMGVMFYELVCGKLPFGADADDEHELLGAILEDSLEFPGRYNDQQGKKLMQGLLCKQPEQRLGCGVKGWEEVKEHRYFKAGVSGNLFSKIIGHDIDAPVVPPQEQYSNEKDLNATVTLSDAEELAEDTPQGAVREKVLSTFKRFDVNGDGIIDRSELRRLLQLLDPETFCDDNAEKLLDAVDTNKDGCIQFEEFLSWVVGDDSGQADAFRKAAELDIH